MKKDIKREFELLTGSSSYNPKKGDYWHSSIGKLRVKYKSNAESPFALSRGKVSEFLSCPRCFYFRTKHGLQAPGGPPFLINSRIDALAKNEMDYIRFSEKYDIHPVFKEHNLNLKPFVPENASDLKDWRDDSYRFLGITHLYEKYNFMLTGIIDDVMINEDGELVVIDFKATSKKTNILTFKDVSYGTAYQMQLEWYKWLLEQKGYKVSSTAYLLYWNADHSQEYLKENKVNFKRTLVEINCDTSWVEDLIDDIFECLEQDSPPEIKTKQVKNKTKMTCDTCAFLNTYSKIV